MSFSRIKSWLDHKQLVALEALLEFLGNYGPVVKGAAEVFSKMDVFRLERATSLEWSSHPVRLNTCCHSVVLSKSQVAQITDVADLEKQIADSLGLKHRHVDLSPVEGAPEIADMTLFSLNITVPGLERPSFRAKLETNGSEFTSILSSIGTGLNDAMRTLLERTNEIALTLPKNKLPAYKSMLRANQLCLTGKATWAGVSQWYDSVTSLRDSTATEELSAAMAKQSTHTHPLVTDKTRQRA